MIRRLGPWLLMALVAGTALAIGVTGERGPTTEAERARAIADEVKCPTCQGLSAAESDAKAARAIRTEITDRLRAGESPDDIRAFLVSRYGDDILLRPSATGISGLVWAIPVAGFVAAVAGLAAAFARWRRRSGDVAVSDADRRLVDDALAGTTPR